MFLDELVCWEYANSVLEELGRVRPIGGQQPCAGAATGADPRAGLA
jgi:hypothetical protein